MSVDEIVIRLKAGNGGNGRVSFAHDKMSIKGGPDGGNGGKGGSIIIKCDENLNTLEHLAGKSLIRAKNGGQGGKSNMKGGNARPVILRVPPGSTLIDPDNGIVMKELNRHEEQIEIVQGGEGGKGNNHFKRATHQTPSFAQPGAKGEERKIKIDLKLIADVGIVGLPNAGKSSLLRQLSNATPKVAAYPFTTLGVHLGVLELENYKTVTIADIPGLIQGAHAGKGLGDKFLRHIERTKILIHLIDVSQESISDPVNSYRIIRDELENYSKTLREKKEILVANKIDLKGSQARVRSFQKSLEKPVIAISCVAGTGLKKLVRELGKLVS